MNPKLVFDLANKGLDWSSLITGLIIFAFGLVAIWMEKLRVGSIVIKRIGYVMCAVGLLVVVFLFGDSYVGKAEGVKALRSRNYSTAEGRVHDFHPMPYEGHAEESFTVAGHRFSYSDYVETHCFNNTSSHGGPMREGLLVRISYSDNCILRIEVLPAAGFNNLSTR